jgi:hypothetical protein
MYSLAQYACMHCHAKHTQEDSFVTPCSCAPSPHQCKIRNQSRFQKISTRTSAPAADDAVVRKVDVGRVDQVLHKKVVAVGQVAHVSFSRVERRRPVAHHGAGRVGVELRDEHRRPPRSFLRRVCAGVPPHVQEALPHLPRAKTTLEGMERSICAEIQGESFASVHDVRQRRMQMGKPSAQQSCRVRCTEQCINFLCMHAVHSARLTVYRGR